jgi:hypothetical protein
MLAADLQDPRAVLCYCIETQRRICSPHLTRRSWTGSLALQIGLKDK